MKYLGIELEFIKLKLIWIIGVIHLHLTLWGKVNTMKMVVAPQINYNLFGMGKNLEFI